MVKTTLPKKLHATRVTSPKKKIDFDKLYKGSYYTIECSSGDLKKWKTEYQKLLNEKGIGTIKGWVTFKGKDINEYYNLTGYHAYPQTLRFLAFPLTGLNISKLAIFKRNDHWFNEIVDN